MKKLLVCFLCVSLITLSIQTTEDSDSSEADSGTLVSDNFGQSFNKTNSNDKPGKKEILPEAYVILPIRRRGTLGAKLGDAPCGGAPKLKANTFANSNSLINVIWETRTPYRNGNCTVKISPGMESESNFLVLYNNDGSSQPNGMFPCGRKKGFESKQFKLPENYVCDQCTLQWSWITPVGNVYSCSDIIINGNKIDACMARCLNQGACFNGKCICVEGFSGEFCEINLNEESGYGGFVFILIFLIIIGGAIVFFLMKGDNAFLKNLVNKENKGFANDEGGENQISAGISR